MPGAAGRATSSGSSLEILFFETVRGLHYLLDLAVALVEVYPVFDFRPMNYLAAHADLPIRRLAMGYQGVALSIVYRIRITARFRGCSREIRGDFVIFFCSLCIRFSIGWLILIRAISEVE